MEKYKYKYNDLSGQKFGRLTVIRRVENRIQPNGSHKTWSEKYLVKIKKEKGDKNNEKV